MMRFRLFITTLLMFIALYSMQANCIVYNKVGSIQHESITNPTAILNNSPASLIVIHKAVPTPALIKKAAQQQPESLGFESLQPRLAVSNSSLFLYQSQVEPNYAAIFEFFVPSLARQHFLQPLEPPTKLPWFVAYEGKKSRLSGWKETNLQYRAVLTFHC